MTLHPSDFLRFIGGPYAGESVGALKWPPPETLVTHIEGGHYERERMSAITDEEIATMTHVARGAEYRWVLE